MLTFHSLVFESFDALKRWWSIMKRGIEAGTRYHRVSFFCTVRGIWDASATVIFVNGHNNWKCWHVDGAKVKVRESKMGYLLQYFSPDRSGWQLFHPVSSTACKAKMYLRSELTTFDGMVLLIKWNCQEMSREITLPAFTVTTKLWEYHVYI